MFCFIDSNGTIQFRSFISKHKNRINNNKYYHTSMSIYNNNNNDLTWPSNIFTTPLTQLRVPLRLNIEMRWDRGAHQIVPNGHAAEVPVELGVVYVVVV